ncbi:MAG: hypothetical protein JHC87_07920 [Thermoleophilaceae bacterium]|nr:hypothetical protein [Thermoleophilaceae bacterium]
MNPFEKQAFHGNGVLAIAAVGAVLIALAAAPSSGAAVTVGADIASVPTFPLFADPLVLVESLPGPLAAGQSPINGVLVAARVRTTGGAQADGVIRVLRQTSHVASTYSFLNVAQVPLSVTADATPDGHITEVATRIPLLAGDRLGLQFPSDGGGTTKSVAVDPAFECAYRSAAPFAVGASLDFNASSCAHNVPLVAGTVESDFDGDGYGDDTQDSCPYDADIHVGLCKAELSMIAPAMPKKIRVGRKLKTLYTIKNQGPATAVNAVASIRVSSRFKVLSLKVGGKSCANGSPRTCALGSIASGSFKQIVVYVKARKAGKARLSGSVACDNTERVPGNESGSTKTKILRAH